MRVEDFDTQLQSRRAAFCVLVLAASEMHEMTNEHRSVEQTTFQLCHVYKIGHLKKSGAGLPLVFEILRFGLNDQTQKKQKMFVFTPSPHAAVAWRRRSAAPSRSGGAHHAAEEGDQALAHLALVADRGQQQPRLVVVDHHIRVHGLHGLGCRPLAPRHRVHVQPMQIIIYTQK